MKAANKFTYLTLSCLGLLLASTPYDGAAQTQANPIRVGGAIRSPDRIHWVPPIVKNPTVAKAATVAIELVIDPAGQVAEVRILKSVPGFDEAVIAAARQWRYAPTTVLGKPAWVRVVSTIRVTDTGAALVGASDETVSCSECATGEFRISTEVDVRPAANGASSCGPPPTDSIERLEQLVRSLIKSDPTLAERPLAIHSREPVVGAAVKQLWPRLTLHDVLSYGPAGKTNCVIAASYLPGWAKKSRVRLLASGNAGSDALLPCRQDGDCGETGAFVPNEPFGRTVGNGSLIYLGFAARGPTVKTIRLEVYYARK